MNQIHPAMAAALRSICPTAPTAVDQQQSQHTPGAGEWLYAVSGYGLKHGHRVSISDWTIDAASDTEARSVFIEKHMADRVNRYSEVLVTDARRVQNNYGVKELTEHYRRKLSDAKQTIRNLREVAAPVIEWDDDEYMYTASPEIAQQAVLHLCEQYKDELTEIAMQLTAEANS